MKGQDFRSIGREAQENRRQWALRLIEQRGLSQAQAAKAVGVQRQTVNIWLQRYRAQGADGLLDGRRVSPRLGKGPLTAQAAGEIQGWIAGNTPDRLKLPCVLWTLDAVRELIALRLAQTLGRATVQLYLQRWGMFPPRPLAQAKERRPAVVDHWLDWRYPAIAKRARREGAAIYWAATTGIANQDPIGRTYASRGRTPLTRSMLLAASNRGLRRFMLYDGALHADRCIAFLRRLGKDAGQKVFLIVDNLPVHRANKVRAWVAAQPQPHAIELFYLPASVWPHYADDYLNTR